MITRASLKQKVDERRNAIQKLDRERDRLFAEIAAFEEILTELENDPPGSDGLVSDRPAPTESRSFDENAPIHKSTRGLSPNWKVVLKRLGREDQFDYNAVVSTANKCGVDVNKPGARSRIFGYVQSGYVERISDGVFRLTQKGKEAAE